MGVCAELQRGLLSLARLCLSVRHRGPLSMIYCRWGGLGKKGVEVWIFWFFFFFLKFYL